MGTYRVLLACLALLAVAPAQQPAKDQFKVEGIVINGLTGKPLPRALVELAGRPVLSGPEGEFSLDGIPAGKMQIRVQKPGYYPPGARTRGWVSGPNIDVSPDTGKIILKLLPEAVISGHVAGRDEEPLEGASIQALTFFPVDGRRQLGMAHGDVRTDEDGNFRIAELPPGRYFLAVKAGNVTRRVLGAQTATGSEAYPALTYYPGTSNLAAATGVDLAAGQHMDVHFSLAPAAAYKVAGTLVTVGDPKHVSVPAFEGPLGPLLSPEQFDSQSGAFEFRAVPAGTYTLRATGVDAQDQRMFASRKVTVSGPITNLKLSLQPGANIPVGIRTEFSRPQTAGHCTTTLRSGEVHESDCSDYPAARVELIAVDSSNSRFSTDFGPVKDPSAFGVHGVAPGKYLVRASPTSGGYVQSLRSGTVDLLRDPLIVPEDGTVTPIEIVLRDDSGRLKVLVRADNPRQPATVLFLPEASLSVTPQIMGTYSNVEFESQAVAPGNYKVFAFDSLNGVDYANPDVLAKYASKAASVTVSANNSASVVVDVIHTGDE